MGTTIHKFGFLQIAWRRKSLIALCLIVGLVAGGLYYAQAKPAYQSTAQVLVVKKRPEVVTGENTGLTQFEDYITTHRILIQSPLIVERAIRLGKLRGLQTFANNSNDLTQAVIKNLSVGRPSRDSQGLSANNVLSLSYRGPVAEECGTIVNAVLDSYRTFLDETYRNMSDDTVKLITEAREVLKNDLEKREIAHPHFARRPPCSGEARTRSTRSRRGFSRSRPKGRPCCSAGLRWKAS